MSEPTKIKKPRRINPKQKLFAEKVLEPGKTQTQAYVEVYGGNPRTAQSKAATLVAKPYVQEHIQKVVDRKFPELSDDCASALATLIKNPETNDHVRLKAIDLIAKYMGWNAPTRSEHLHAKIDVSKFKLPGGE